MPIVRSDLPALKLSTFEVRCDVCGRMRMESVSMEKRTTWSDVLGDFRRSEAGSKVLCPDCLIVEVLATALYF